MFYSNDFSRANWTKAGSVLTSGQTGYDGTNDAWLLEKNSANGNIYQPISLSGIASLSFYAKANTTDWIRVRNGSGYVYFDVANGVVGGNINAVNASIISIFQRFLSNLYLRILTWIINIVFRNRLV